MTRTGLAAAVLIALALPLLGPRPARGHGLEPALLSLRERAPGRFEVVWKSSKLRLPGAEVRPLLPARCRPTAEEPQASDDGERLRLRWMVDCGPDGLAGTRIAVADLDVATIDALLRIERLDGTTVQSVLTARHPSWTAPVDPTRAQLVRHFADLGAARALRHVDRLLLLCGLVLLLAATPRRLLQAGAAFVLAQSIALAVIAAGAVAVPPHAVELVIAAALLLAALALTRREPGQGTRRTAWLVGVACGSLSGCAFAATLGDGVSGAIDAPLALLSFTAGLAVPQLAACLAALALARLARQWSWRAGLVASRCAAYALGILAVFWCLERLTA